jgi:hypothetical protein
MKPKFRLILHPFLFALYAVMLLLANNIAFVQFSAIRTGLFSLVGAIVLMGVLWLILKDALRAGLITSGFIMLSFSYGHIQNLLNNVFIGNFSLGQDILLTPLWIALFIIWAYLILRRWRKQDARLEALSWYLNWVSLILNIFPIIMVLNAAGQSERINLWYEPYMTQAWQENGVDNVPLDLSSLQANQGQMPDIYYFVFDAYTRDDILAELYDYDNSAFIQGLQQRGFYVARQSQSNYSATELTISSALNMMHINTMPEYFHDHAGVDGYWVLRNATGRLIQSNRAAAIFRQAGYQFVNFDSGYGLTQIKSADQYVSLPSIQEDSSSDLVIAMMLLDTSLGRLYTHLSGYDFAPLQAMFAAHRQRILFAMEEAPQYAQKPGNYFIFAHIVAPHTPYVFGPNGEELRNVDPYTLMDVHPGRVENISLYSGQVNYMNQLILKMIDEILAKSDTPPIIIMHGDHSSRVYKTLNQPMDLKLKLMFPIFNAYYFPGDGAKDLYSTISPVNSLRVVLNHYFGAKLALQPDISYIFETDTWGRLKFLDVCQVYQFCAP